MISFEKQFVSLVNGKNLLIDLNPVLEVCLEIEPWENGLRYHRKYDNNFIEEVEEIGFPIVTQYYENDPTHPFHNFINKIPNDIRKIIINIDFLQYSVLRVLLKYNNSIQIFHDSHVLLWLLIYKKSIQNEKLIDIDNILKFKRKYIAEEILGVAEEKHVSFLKKIKLFRGDALEAKIIIDSIINGDSSSDFSHIKEVPVQALYIIKKYPILKKSKLLFHYSSLEFNSLQDYLIPPIEIINIINDTINIGNQLGFKDVCSIIRSINEPNNLIKIHDNWVGILNRKIKFLENDIILPVAPINENGCILQIKTANELIQEGIDMNHCIGTYLDKVINGDSFIFKVMHDERATLEIVIRQGDPVVSQMKLNRNGEPSMETWNIVSYPRYDTSHAGKLVNFDQIRPELAHN